jgi:hypothetical protein
MSSITTVEGHLGSRLADALEKKRAAAHAQVEARKAELDARVAGAAVRRHVTRGGDGACAPPCIRYRIHASTR